MPTQPCIGFPADALGSDGDAAQDLQNQIIYYPKANGTWANATAYPFVGPVGPGLLTGNGAPNNSVGAPGNGYADLSSNANTYVKNSSNTWVQVGQIIGAQGVPGPSGQSIPSLASQSYVLGPVAANAAAFTLSGTPQQVPYAGGTATWQFVPQVSTSFAGATLVLSSAGSPGATTYSLVDTTANATRWSQTVSSFGTITNYTASVPLTTGNTHVWTVTGSGSALLQILPVYFQPASAGVTTTYGPLFANNYTTAPTSTTNMFVGGNTSATQYMGLIKSAFLYGAQFTNTGSSAATVGLYNSAGTLLYSVSVPANSTQPFLVGPYTVNQYVLPAGYYTWRVTSSSAGYVSVLPQLCL
jgi:hypothetical protein